MLIFSQATNGGQGNVGSVALIDSSASSVGAVINTKAESTGDDSIVIDNFSAGNSITSTVTAGGNIILTGSVPETWVYGM
jgi:glucan 1,3-beta-glucosidase